MNKVTKRIAVGFASTALAVGGLTLVAPTASASTSANGCVVLVKWTNTNNERRAVVRNDCSTKQCYKIDVPYEIDPKFSVKANATESDKYGSVGWTDQARKIYGGGPC